MTVMEAPNFVKRASPLPSCSHPEMRRLTVIESETHVIVTGRVTGFFLKSLALEAAKLLAAGRTIVLQIEVGE